MGCLFHLFTYRSTATSQVKPKSKNVFFDYLFEKPRFEVLLLLPLNRVYTSHRISEATVCVVYINTYKTP